MTTERGWSVLLADSDDQTRRVLATMLRSHGYEIEEVARGEEALALLDGSAFDLVLLDAELPDRSGIDILAEARPRAPHTAFVVLAGFRSLDVAMEAMRRGAHGYLRIPLHADEVLRVVAGALNEMAARRAVASPGTSALLHSHLRRFPPPRH
jgi:DNA-binding NtrC family response regulator